MHGDGKEKHAIAEILYCVTCKEMCEMKNEQHMTLKNGTPVLRGECVVCGTRVILVRPAEKAAQKTPEKAEASAVQKQGS